MGARRRPGTRPLRADRLRGRAEAVRERGGAHQGDRAEVRGAGPSRRRVPPAAHVHRRPPAREGVRGDRSRHAVQEGPADDAGDSRHRLPGGDRRHAALVLGRGEDGWRRGGPLHVPRRRHRHRRQRVRLHHPDDVRLSERDGDNAAARDRRVQQEHQRGRPRRARGPDPGAAAGVREARPGPGEAQHAARHRGAQLRPGRERRPHSAQGGREDPASPGAPRHGRRDDDPALPGLRGRRPRRRDGRVRRDREAEAADDHADRARRHGARHARRRLQLRQGGRLRHPQPRRVHAHSLAGPARGRRRGCRHRHVRSGELLRRQPREALRQLRPGGPASDLDAREERAQAPDDLERHPRRQARRDDARLGARGREQGPHGRRVREGSRRARPSSRFTA